MTLEEIIQPGHAVRLGQSEKHSRLIHIRAIVDGNQIVFREWSPRKQIWFYHVESMYYFELMHEKGRLALVRKAEPVE